MSVNLVYSTRIHIAVKQSIRYLFHYDHGPLIVVLLKTVVRMSETLHSQGSALLSVDTLDHTGEQWSKLCTVIGQFRRFLLQ